MTKSTNKNMVLVQFSGDQKLWIDIPDGYRKVYKGNSRIGDKFWSYWQSKWCEVGNPSLVKSCNFTVIRSIKHQPVARQTHAPLDLVVAVERWAKKRFEWFEIAVRTRDDDEQSLTLLGSHFGTFKVKLSVVGAEDVITKFTDIESAVNQFNRVSNTWK